MKKTGFTLVELLVVISIIALLLSILMPALGKVREQARCIVCTSNTRQLGLAWVCYAESNNGKLVRGSISSDSQDTDSWVKWIMNSPTPKYQIKGIQQGLLWSYVKNLKIYRCPSASKTELRNYNINSCMNGRIASDNVEDITRIADAKRASERMVFIDQGEIVTTASWNSRCWRMGGSTESWVDQPSRYHKTGTAMSYVDGRAAFYKWVSPTTTKYVSLPNDQWQALYRNNTLNSLVNTVDRKKLYDFTWGRNLVK